MGGLTSKNKGKRGERWLAQRLREAFPQYADTIRRGWQARSGKDAADVEFPGVHFECKNTKRPNPMAALRQAIEDCRKGNIPIAVLLQSRSYPVAILPFEDLLKLLVAADREVEREKQNGLADPIRERPRNRRIRIRRKDVKGG